MINNIIVNLSKNSGELMCYQNSASNVIINAIKPVNMQRKVEFINSIKTFTDVVFYAINIY